MAPYLNHGAVRLGADRGRDFLAETLRVLLFMTFSILVSTFYPVTAVMIVMLALLNDGAILSIAFDYFHYKN